MLAFPLIKKKDYHTMAYLFKGAREYGVYMVPITKEEEEQLDKRKEINIDKGDKIFSIGPTNVKYYGEIDFSKGSDDYRILEESTLFFPMSFQGVSVPANYDYEKHCCYSDERRAKWYDTVNAAVICQYAHGILGKPKRVAIVETWKT